MPIKFWTSVDRDLVVTKWWGEVDLDEFRDTFGMYLTDANYRPGRTELNDFTGVTEFDADFSMIWSALNMVNNQVPGITVKTRTLLVAPADNMYGLTRIYQTLAENAEGITIEVYRAQADALEALGLEFETLDALLNAGGFAPYTAAADEKTKHS